VAFDVIENQTAWTASCRQRMNYEGQGVQGHNYIHETGLLYNLNGVHKLYMYLAVGDNSTLYIKTLYAYAE